MPEKQECAIINSSPLLFHVKLIRKINKNKPLKSMPYCGVKTAND
jgi:hypothetical protein